METTQKWKVVIPDRVSGSVAVEQAVFGDRATIVPLNLKTNDGLAGQIEDADAILAWHDLIWNSRVISSLKNCKSIVRVGAGFDNVDLAAAKKSGIVVSNVPDYGTLDVADHAIALLLDLARGLKGHDKLARSGKSGWVWGAIPTFRVTGKTLGVVGLGRIGTATAMRAKALGMNVAFYDPYKPAGWDKALGVTRIETLEELAAKSDVITLHTPLTAETRGMIGHAFFRATKKGVVFINTARGPVVDWSAFSEFFMSGWIKCAGFDVLPVEPPNLDDPVLKAWVADAPEIANRLVITPHCAFYSDEAVVEMRHKAAAEALRVLAGQKPQNQVN
jgi:D-3-phosphoglycerate dehydrogenase/C-terminal binding protein